MNPAAYGALVAWASRDVVLEPLQIAKAIDIAEMGALLVSDAEASALLNRHLHVVEVAPGEVAVWAPFHLTVISFSPVLV